MDTISYLLGKKSSGGGDLSEYFDTKISSNTSQLSKKSNTTLLKIPPYTVEENVTSLSYCFSEYAYPNIDLSQMNTENITNINRMFDSATMEELDLSSLNVSKVTDMSYVFNNCSNLNKINLSNWDTSSATNMNSMFYSCPNLTKLDCSSFTIKTNTNVGYFVRSTTKLAVLDISKMDFANFTGTKSNMFTSCGSNCLQSDGAYANGIPYIYVKDATAQNWVLTETNGHPSTWSTNNVIIKS